MTKVNTQSTKKVKKYQKSDIETNSSSHYIECAGLRSSEQIRNSIRRDYYGY